MIRSFRDPDAQALFEGRPTPRFGNLRAVAERKLQMLHRAATLSDLRAPPNNRLEALGGDRQGQYSIRINAQWRLCFEWNQGDAWNVQIVDYH